MKWVLVIVFALLTQSLDAEVSQRAKETSFLFFDATDTSAIPKSLSTSGLFKDIMAKTVSSEVTRFDVNTALWSDSAAKIRYFILPADSQITYRDDSAYRFPQGAVLVKNFLIDTIQGNSSSRIYLETRLLVKQFPDDSVTKWFGFSYQWNRDQTDAHLVSPIQGLETTIATWTSAGEAVAKKWSFPSQSACWRCHMSGGRNVLGFYTAELNRPTVADPSINQLEAFVKAGVFRGETFPDFSKSHRWADLKDSSQSLEIRARSYLAVNCSFCHGAEGRKVIGTVLSAIQDLDYFRPEIPINYLNEPAKFDYGIPNSRLVFGGSPEKSILLYRMKNRAMDKMPPLATAEPDTVAVRILSEWIQSLPPPDGAAVKNLFQKDQAKAYILGNMLNINPNVGSKARVQAWDSQGKAVELKQIAPMQYTLPDVHGIIWVQVNSKSKPIMIPLAP